MSCGFDSESMRCNKKSDLNKKWCKQTKYCRKSAKGKRDSPKKKRNINIKDNVNCGFNPNTNRCNQQSKSNSDMCEYNKNTGFCQRKKFIEKEMRKVSENLEILEEEGRDLLNSIKEDTYKHNHMLSRVRRHDDSPVNALLTIFQEECNQARSRYLNIQALSVMDDSDEDVGGGGGKGLRGKNRQKPMKITSRRR